MLIIVAGRNAGLEDEGGAEGQGCGDEQMTRWTEAEKEQDLGCHGGVDDSSKTRTVEGRGGL